ncbi:MAG: UDP-2,3-diacylglucosamine diphosphatase [Rubrivivax sp.]
MPVAAGPPARLPLPQLLSPVPEWVAPPAWRCIELLSDLHLAPEMPRTFEAFAAQLRDTGADALLILGDLFEVWVGDDQRHRPFEQRCVQLLARTARTRRVAFMPGNRDFLLGDAMAADSGIERLNDPTVLVAWGRRWLLSHGDALCLDDVDYQRWRAEARSDPWQREFAALPLDERLARAGAARAASERRRAADAFDPALWADVDPDAARAWLDTTGCADLIHGHTHRPGTSALGAGHHRHVLSDWDLDHAGSARAGLLRLTPAGLSRHPPSTATASG